MRQIVNRKRTRAFLYMIALVFLGHTGDILAQDAAEMARAMQDPLASISAIMTDNDINFKTGKDDETSYSFQIQALHAFSFERFTFIPRLILPIMGVAPTSKLPRQSEPTPSGDSTIWGLSDLVTQFFFAPKAEGSWKWGAGPMFAFQTRTSDDVGGTGAGAGPIGVLVGSFSDNITFAGIAGNLWSYDGNFNSMVLQPMLYYNFPSIEGAYIAYNAAISADWKASSANTWTVPLGAVVGRTFALSGGYGVDLLIGPYWNVVNQENGADWFLKFGVSLLLPMK